MKVKYHVMASAGIGGVLYAAGAPPSMAVASLVAGVCIDVDHVLDYLIQFGIASDWRSNFFRSFYERQYDRIYILLHGWEWAAALILAAALLGNPLLIGAAIGVTQHLIQDQMSNGGHAAVYSLLWRIAMRFDPAREFPVREK